MRFRVLAHRHCAFACWLIVRAAAVASIHTRHACMNARIHFLQRLLELRAMSELPSGDGEGHFEEESELPHSDGEGHFEREESEGDDEAGCADDGAAIEDGAFTDELANALAASPVAAEELLGMSPPLTHVDIAASHVDEVSVVPDCPLELPGSSELFQDFVEQCDDNLPLGPGGQPQGEVPSEEPQKKPEEEPDEEPKDELGAAASRAACPDRKKAKEESKKAAEPKKDRQKVARKALQEKKHRRRKRRQKCKSRRKASRS